MQRLRRVGQLRRRLRCAPPSAARPPPTTTAMLEDRLVAAEPRVGGGQQLGRRGGVLPTRRGAPAARRRRRRVRGLRPGAGPWRRAATRRGAAALPARRQSRPHGPICGSHWRGRDRLDRMRLLRGAVEVALARGGLDEAERHCAELESGAEAFGTPGLSRLGGARPRCGAGAARTACRGARGAGGARCASTAPSNRGTRPPRSMSGWPSRTKALATTSWPPPTPPPPRTSTPSSESSPPRCADSDVARRPDQARDRGPAARRRRRPPTGKSPTRSASARRPSRATWPTSTPSSGSRRAPPRSCGRTRTTCCCKYLHHSHHTGTGIITWFSGCDSQPRGIAWVP